MAAHPESRDAVLPDLGRWLEKVFWVLGGYMVATGILRIHLAQSGVRDGSATALVVAAAAGVVSVGLMAVVNLMLRSDFRWALLGLAALWAAAALLAALGVRGVKRFQRRSARWRAVGCLPWRPQRSPSQGKPAVPSVIRSACSGHHVAAEAAAGQHGGVAADVNPRTYRLAEGAVPGGAAPRDRARRSARCASPRTRAAETPAASGSTSRTTSTSRSSARRARTRARCLEKGRPSPSTGGASGRTRRARARRPRPNGAKCAEDAQPKSAAACKSDRGGSQRSSAVARRSAQGAGRPAARFPPRVQEQLRPIEDARR